MDREERQKIYALLAQYFPNAKQLKDRKTITAWGLALEKFPYLAVKNAVVNYAITNKYFPDLADITGGLTPESAVAAAPTPPPPASEQTKAVQLYYRYLNAALEEHGIRPFSGSTGAEYIAWRNLCLSHGVDVFAICERALMEAHS